LEPLKGSIHS